MNNRQIQEKPTQAHSQKQKLNKKLTLHKETIKELTDIELHNVAGGTSGTITLILISLRERVCL